MRFYLSGISKDNKPLFVALWFFVLFILFYWIGNLVIFSVKFGFSVEKISYYFFGDENFPEKISFTQLSEDKHIYLFINAILLLSLSGIFLYTYLSFKKKLAIVLSAFLTGILDTLSDYIIYGLGKEWAFVKILSFTLFNGCLLIMIFSVLSHFITGKAMDKPNETGNKFYRTIITAFAVVNIIFIGINIFLAYTKLGFSPQQISTYYLGDETHFIQAKSFVGILETAVIHFAGMAIYLIALAHFVFFTEFRWKLALVTLIFISAFIDIVAAFPIRFVAAEFSYLKIISFWLMQMSMLYASYILLRNAFVVISCDFQRKESITNFISAEKKK